MPQLRSAAPSPRQLIGLLATVILIGVGSAACAGPHHPASHHHHHHHRAHPSPSPAPSPAPSLQPTAAHPCGLTTKPPAQVQHVVWILMENRDDGDIIGSGAAPYINQLAQVCGFAPNYSAITHPSLPNYIALSSGSTQGITDDGDPSEHPLSAPSIFSLLGSGWTALDGSMPGNCDQNSGGEYAARHNPAVYYTNVASQCSQQDVPLGSTPDIANRFTFITPNLIDDMHDGTIQQGDTWLSQELPLLIATPQYQSGDTLIFITWDEGTANQLVPLLVLGPSVPQGARPQTAYSHYSLLRTTEELLGLSPLLGAAATAPSLTPGVNL